MQKFFNILHYGKLHVMFILLSFLSFNCLTYLSEFDVVQYLVRLENFAVFFKMEIKSCYMLRKSSNNGRKSNHC